MSAIPVYTADEALRHINYTLEKAGSGVRVTAVIDGDDLTVKTDPPNQEYVQPFRRSPSGCWFVDISEAASYFAAIT